jgi:hypothetical protein
MNSFRIALAAMLVMIAGSAGGQREDRAPFQPRDGYEEARFGSQEVTIRTRDGAKTVRVSLSMLRVAPPSKHAAIRLPGTGLALLQHVGGSAKVVVRRESFEPFEGEWVRLPLPAEFSLVTENDTAQLDLIVIEERDR